MTSSRSTPPPGNPRDPRERYPLRAILETRDFLEKTLRFEFVGRTVTPANFSRLVQLCWEHLPGIDRAVLADSLRGVGTRPLTAVEIRDLAHRLAGNLPALKKGALRPWTPSRRPEWVPVQVMEAHWARGPRRVLGASFEFKFMAGTPCPRRVSQFWSLRRCRFHARGFGFGRGINRHRGTLGTRPFEDPLQFATLRFLGRIDPVRSAAAGEPVISAVEFPDTESIRTWNRMQLDRRARVGFRCPLKLPDSFPCHRCAAGYSHCLAGTHPANYAVGPCPTCGRAEALLEFSGAVFCVACTVFVIKHPHKDPPREESHAEV